MSNKNNEMTYMKYFIDGIPPEIVKKAEKELKETEELKAECLKEIRCLIKNEPDLYSCMEDAFLLRFLRSKKYNVDKAFKTLKNFYAYKATYSGILTDFRPSDIKKFLDMGVITALEHRDSSYAAIGVVHVGRINTAKMSADDLFATGMTLGEIGINMESITVTGYSIILDFEGVSFSTIRAFSSPTFLYRMMMGIQDVIPCRIKGYHVVNQPYLFHLIFSVLKTLLSEKLADRFHLHGSNLKSLYKHVPQDILPEELGGKQGPMSKYLKEYSKKVMSMEDHFIKMNKFGYQGKTLEELQKNNPNAIVT